MLDTKSLHELTKNLLDGMTSYMNLGIEDGSFEAYSQEDIDACGEIINSFLQAVLKEGIQDSEVLSHVEIAVKKLNQLNKRCDYQLIETDQREDICKIIIEAARQVGYTFPPNDDDITYEWREW